jgi:gas vesicle protein
MKNSTKILAAAAVGIAAGGLLGLLFAPDKGAETRKKFTKKGGTILNKIKGEFNKEKMARLKEKLEARLQKVNAKMEEISKEEYSKYV